MAKNSVKFEGALTSDTRKVINDNFEDVSTVTTEFDVDSGSTADTLTNVAGLVTDTLDMGTYKFEVHLDMLSTANCGVKAAFKFGTASMLTSIRSTAKGFTASGVAVQKGTTATDAANIFASTTAVTNLVITGTLVVAVPGTLQLQAAQNASHADNTTIYVGSYMTFKKIA